MGQTGDTVNVGTTKLFINGILHYLTGFNYFAVGSNSVAGGTTGAKVTQKMIAGRENMNGVVVSGLIGSLPVLFPTSFINTPAVCLTPTSLNSTVLANNTYWVTAVSNKGFTINVANTTTNRYMNWVAIGK